VSHKVLCIWFYFLAVAILEICCCQADPDPKALIQGVESTREQIPPSCLLIRAVYRDSYVSNRAELWVMFDRDRRYFTRTNSGPEVRMLWNSSEVLRFDGNKYVVIRNLDTGTADYLFDPRVLGIVTSYSWGATIANCLPYRDALRIELIGREQVDGKSAWHVRLFSVFRSQVDLWIDEKNGFRVYRYDEKMEGAGERSMRCFYENGAYQWLPSRIEGDARNAEGTTLYRREITMLQATANVKIPEATWTLSGLRLPLSAQVVDVRTKSMGWWDGQRVSSGLKQTKPHPPPIGGPRGLILVVLAVLAAAPLAMLYRTRSMRRRGAGH